MRSIRFLLLAALLLATQARPAANRLWLAGFELNSASTGVEWHSVSGSPTVSTTQVHAGTYAGLTNTAGAATEYFQRNLTATVAGDIYFARAYIYVTDAPDSNTLILLLGWGADAAAGAAIRLNTDLTLTLIHTPNSPTAVGSNSGALSLNTWYYIEVNSNFDTNACEGRLDGSSFASSATCGANQRADFVRAGLGVNGTTVANAEIYWDDVAVNNDSGTAQTSWPGEGYIVHLHPNTDGDADSGVTSAAGCTNGEGRWDCIAEVTPDDGTTRFYLTGTTSLVDVGITDPIAPDSNDTVSLVAVGARLATGNTCTLATGAGNYRNRIKSQASGTVAAGSLQAISTASFFTHGATPVTYNLVQYVDPQAGGAWTATLLTNTQIGIATTDGTPDTCVTTLWAAVEYVPVAAPAGCTPLRGLLGVGCN